jgi:hypothetical protein
MFAQFLIYIGLIIVALWIAWKFIIAPILEAKGIDIDEGDVPTLEEIRTKHTEHLERLMAELEQKKASKEAAKESAWIMREIKDLEREIKDAEDIMTELK